MIFTFSPILLGSQQQGYEERLVHSCPCNSDRYSTLTEFILDFYAQSLGIAHCGNALYK